MQNTTSEVLPMPTVTTGLPIEQIRGEFPMLAERDGAALTYLDNASSSLKPRAMIDRLQEFYASEYAHPEEVHKRSRHVTELLEQTRADIALLINAREPEEIVFVRSTTEAINTLALSFERGQLREGDEVLITAMEHVANIIPWQLVCADAGAKLRVAPITRDGTLDMDAFRKCLTPRTRLVSVTQVSNVFGIIYPIEEIVQEAHAMGIPVFVDGAQSAPHLAVDVQKLGCDFFALSAHKMCGPTAVGVLYGRREWLDKPPPSEGGGSMAKSVQWNSMEPASIPKKFEAGTPPIGELVGFDAAISYRSQWGMPAIELYERYLTAYADERLRSIPEVTVLGTGDKICCVSFTVSGMKPKEVEVALDKQDIVVRGGTLSAEPLMQSLGLSEGAVRVSIAFYNTRDELDRFIQAVEHCASAHGFQH
jgi:cysteine desulfurase/selenocysteine lyase